MKKQNAVRSSLKSKLPTGIEGIDDIARGGLPCGGTTLITGGPGSGKTVFALQTLVNGARSWGEAGIFVAFEENSRQIIANATSFGWDLTDIENKKLFFIDARVPADTSQPSVFNLAGLLEGLTTRIAETGAKRIIFDSIDVLLTLLDDIAAERREIYRLHDWLAALNLIGIITVRVQDENTLEPMRYTFLQYVADCVIQLKHYLLDRVSTRGLRILKYRGSSYAENEFPMAITADGIEIASPGRSEEKEAIVFKERVSSGIDRLDQMLNGGYLRGSSVLITGAPGTAKSTLSGAFALAACLRNEKTLYVSFDESANEIVRNMTSTNMNLAPYKKSGLLVLRSMISEARSAEEHLIKMRGLIKESKPSIMIIDPLSAIIKSGGILTALGVAKRILQFTKSMGITLLCTSLLEGNDAMIESTPMQISTIADTWIQLSYVIMGGERNRALSIIKSRGTKHSNQVRELILSDSGVTLSDVYSAGGEVIMGTLRWEKELQLQQEQERITAEAEHIGAKFKATEADINARITALKYELQAKQAEFERESVDRKQHEKRLKSSQEYVQTLRGIDVEKHEKPRKNPSIC